MSKEKIDEALGLGAGGIDDFLDNLDVTTPTQELSKKLNDIDDQVKNQVQQLDTEIAEYNKTGDIQIANIESSLSQIKDLIGTSKDVIRHTYEAIKSTDIVDPEVLSSFAKILEASHIAISEYITLYRDRVNFCDKVKLEMLKHQQKKELLQLKYELESKKIEAKAKDVTPTNMMSYSQEDVINLIDKID